jgi:hypothetical protein
MPQDIKKIIKRLTAQLFTYPIEDYLSSENFSLFCKEHDLVDAWREKLESSRDRPDLYGDAVIKNAFVLFLHHIFHCRPGEFLELFAHIVIGFSQEISQALPVNDLKKDLVYLGYSDEEVEIDFSNLEANERENQNRGTT